MGSSPTIKEPILPGSACIPEGLRQSLLRQGAQSEIAVCTSAIAPNLRRKRELRVATEVWQAGNARFVVKRALAESQAFLTVIHHRDQQALRFFGGRAEAVCGELIGSSLIYPFVPHPTLQSLIAGKLEERQADVGLDLINAYIGFVRDLPGSRCIPREFLQALSLSEAQFGATVQCIDAGPVDLIPDNILVADNRWYICDNEFFFSWATPVELVLFRGIATLVNRLQRQIRAAAAPWRLIAFSGYGRHRSFIPDSWVDVFRENEIPLRVLAAWSYRFERTVLYECSRSSLCSTFLDRAGQKRAPWATVLDLGAWAVDRCMSLVRRPLRGIRSPHSTNVMRPELLN